MVYTCCHAVSHRCCSFNSSFTLRFSQNILVSLFKQRASCLNYILNFVILLGSCFIYKKILVSIYMLRIFPLVLRDIRQGKEIFHFSYSKEYATRIIINLEVVFTIFMVWVLIILRTGTVHLFENNILGVPWVTENICREMKADLTSK